MVFTDKKVIRFRTLISFVTSTSFPVKRMRTKKIHYLGKSILFKDLLFKPCKRNYKILYITVSFILPPELKETSYQIVLVNKK
jgi:hypothetical protein